MAIQEISNGERGRSVRTKLNTLISMFNASGFGVGPANNIFGATSGDIAADPLTVSPAANKTAAEGVRDTYFTANPANLTEYDNSSGLHIFLLYTENTDTVLEAQSRIGSAWVRSLALFAIQGVPGEQMSLAAITDRNVPFNDNGTFADSPYRVLANGEAFIEGVTNIEGGTLSMGPFVQLSERGGFVGLSNALGDEFTFVDYRTPQDAPSSTPRILEYTEAENNFDIQTVQTESLSSPVVFNYTPTLLARTNSLIGQVGTAITNFRFRIAVAANTSQVLKYWPSEAAWLDGTGDSFNPGQMVIDFEDTELPLNDQNELQIDIMFDSGTLLGDTNGFPALTAVLQRGQFVDMAMARDIVQSDWNETDNSSNAYIANKPTLPPSNAEQNVQADWNETNTNSDAFIQNKPTIPASRTDEEIRDVVGATLVAGTNVTIMVDDDANTITIAATGGGSAPPTPVNTDLRYGLSTESAPASVVFNTLTDVASPTDPQTVSTGTTTAGQYFHIFSANTHDIQTIRDTVLDQIVYQDGGTGNIFTKQNDVRTEGSVTYDSYTIGPLNAGIDEEYVLRFS